MYIMFSFFNRQQVNKRLHKFLFFVLEQVLRELSSKYEINFKCFGITTTAATAAIVVAAAIVDITILLIFNNARKTRCRQNSLCLTDVVD